MNKIKWDDLYKIRTTNYNQSMDKHEIVKLLLVRRILEKYKRNPSVIRVYTEFNLGKKICDIYFENLRTREIYIYEIQENITDEWLDQTKEFYNNYEVFKMTTDLIVVDLKKLSNNLDELYEQLDEYIM